MTSNPEPLLIFCFGELRNESDTVLQKPDDLSLHPLSGMDSVGKLFWHKKELFRGIIKRKAAFYEELFSSGMIENLVKNGLLVETWKADWFTDDFPLVVQHKVIPVVTYASEWCASQLQAAALICLDLELALREKCLTLWDVSPWNIVFDKSHAVWVDFCSIHPSENENEWRARDQFNRFFLNPLLLFEAGLPRVARRMLFDPVVGIPSSEVLKLVNISHQIKIKSSFVDRLKSLLWKKPKTANDGVITELRELRNQIAGFSFALKPSQWAGYHDDNFPSLEPSPQWTDKHRSMLEVFETAKPKTVLDLGANRGWYSQLAAKLGARVIAADTDDQSLNDMYLDVKNSDLPISTVYMDFRFPEPAQGPAYKMLAPASERLNSEMVVALALIHHLVFTWYMSFEQIVDNLSVFTQNWLAVEFIGINDTVVKEGLCWSEEYFPWYGVESFMNALDKSFHIVKTLPSDWGGLPNKGGRNGEMDRTIFLCQKKF